MGWKRAINSYRTMIALSVIVVVLGLIYIIVADEPSESLFGAGNLEGKGKLVSLYLTAIGGCAVFYGLWLNSRRIGEQTRQNNIADKTNNDKRFGEAIGYLNSENTGVAIGGAYALHQLAFEDTRYREIVSDIFVQYLTRVTKTDFSEETYKVNKIILRIIFQSGSFYDYFDIENTYIVGVTLEETRAIAFRNTVIEQCVINSRNMIIIENSQIDSTSIHLFNSGLALNDCFVENSTIELYGTNYTSNFTIEDSDIRNTKILAAHGIENIFMKNNFITGLLIAAGSYISGNIWLKENPVLEIRCPNVDKLTMKGDRSSVTIKLDNPYA